METIQVFKLGSKDCEHEWIYKTLSQMAFVYNQTYFQFRICPKCGHVDIIQNAEVYRNESDLYERIYNKFHN